MVSVLSCQWPGTPGDSPPLPPEGPTIGHKPYLDLEVSTEPIPDDTPANGTWGRKVIITNIGKGTVPIGPQTFSGVFIARDSSQDYYLCKKWDIDDDIPKAGEAVEKLITENDMDDKGLNSIPIYYDVIINKNEYPVETNYDNNREKTFDSESPQQCTTITY